MGRRNRGHGHHLLDSPFLEALGLDTKEFLVAACDNIGAEVSADQLMSGRDFAPGTVAKFLTAGVYYSDRFLAEYTDGIDSSDHDEEN